MYVTLEPCQMCAGAAVQARLDRAVTGVILALVLKSTGSSMGTFVSVVLCVGTAMLFFYGLLYRFSASHYLSGGTLCCLYGTYQTGNEQGTSRCYQLCCGVCAVRFVYCLCSRLHQEDK